MDNNFEVSVETSTVNYSRNQDHEAVWKLLYSVDFFFNENNVNGKNILFITNFKFPLIYAYKS